jgi:mannosyl-3-phosphoglycerate synthase
MSVETVRFASIVPDRRDDRFFERTAFVVSHKDESLETLVGVLWYLPAASPIFVVTNCPVHELAALASGIGERLADHMRVYVVHQKDAALAAFFQERGIFHIVGTDGRVVDGKGEGMYIGALCASLLPGVEWVVYYDADNFVPSALLEYSFALARLFSEARVSAGTLHNVRICWASKPSLDGEGDQAQVLGRCSKVVSPLVSLLFAENTGKKTEIVTSNAGEQGFSLRTVQILRFSSAYSIETLQLIDLFAHSLAGRSEPALLQQYQAQSPHFHHKGDLEHIKRMIAQSIGAFLLYPDLLTPRVKRAIAGKCAELGITPILPQIYPPLLSLDLQQVGPAYLEPYKLDLQAEKLGERSASQAAAFVG